MKILFRVDAGAEIGLGHYYRSLNLAEKLMEKGHNITFCHRESDFWNQRQMDVFFIPHFTLSTLHSEQETLEYIESNEVDIFYVDGIINFSEEFISEAKKTAKVVFYQNNSLSKKYANVFISPAIQLDHNFLKDFTSQTTLFLGLEYVTFHPSIYKLNRKNSLSNEVQKIAIIAGGSDPSNTLKTIHDYIPFEEYKEIEFTFYFGNDYLFKSSLPFSNAFNVNFEPFNHNEILQNDVLIGAFGVSIYEFLYLGMPVLSYGHQKSNAMALNIFENITHSLINLGLITELELYTFKHHFVTIVNDFERRNLLVKNAQRILDINGVDRVVNIIESIN